MRWMMNLGVVLVISVLSSIPATVMAQEDGEAILDRAVDLKLEAKTPRDFDKIADLCEQAIEEGLENDETAKKLWASANLEYAKLQAEKILNPNPDRRWKILRQQTLERLEKATELTPDSFESWALIAELNLREGGDEDDAKEAVAKALELSKDKPAQQTRLYFLQAQTSDDEDERLEAINKALENDPKNLFALQFRARLMLRQEKYDKAIEDMATLAESQNDNPAGLILLAGQLQRLQKNDAALKAVTKAIEINQDVPAAYSLRASLYLAEQKTDEALKDVSRAIELSPRDIEALRTRARVYLQTEKYDDALKDVEKILIFNEGDGGAVFLRSLIYGAKEDFEAAIEDMQLLLAGAPGDPQLRSILASFYNGNNETDKAMKLYDDLIKEDPQDQQALAGRADTKLNAGLHAEAIGDYEAVLAIDDADDHALNNLAWLLATSTFDDVRDGKRAVELAEKAMEVTEGKEAHILSTLAAAYAETGDFDKAVEWSEKSVELAGDDKQRADLTEELELFKQGKPVRENEAEDRKKEEQENKKEDKKSAEDEG